MQVRAIKRKTACTAGYNHSTMRPVIFARKGAGFLNVALALRPFMLSVLVYQHLLQDKHGVVLCVRTADTFTALQSRSSMKEYKVVELYAWKIAYAFGKTLNHCTRLHNARPEAMADSNGNSFISLNHDEILRKPSFHLQEHPNTRSALSSTKS